MYYMQNENTEIILPETQISSVCAVRIAALSGKQASESNAIILRAMRKAYVQENITSKQKDSNASLILKHYDAFKAR